MTRRTKHLIGSRGRRRMSKLRYKKPHDIVWQHVQSSGNAPWPPCAERRSEQPLSPARWPPPECRRSLPRRGPARYPRGRPRQRPARTDKRSAVALYWERSIPSTRRKSSVQSVGLLSWRKEMQGARARTDLAARVERLLDDPDVRLQGRGVHGLETVPVREQLARGEERAAAEARAREVVKRWEKAGKRTHSSRMEGSQEIKREIYASFAGVSKIRRSSRQTGKRTFIETLRST